MSSSPDDVQKGKRKASGDAQDQEWGGTMNLGLSLSTVTSLLALQDVEDHKPRLSKISWLPDVLVYSDSVIPTVLGPVLTVTLFSAAVAAASILYGKEVGLTNNVVPLLSVVVALLLVFRNTSAYERFAEGRKDFTTLISNARNLSRNIWIAVCLPPDVDGKAPQLTREQLTEEKKRLIRLVVAFVVATKHHLRSEGGVHHEDLRGLLPPHLTHKADDLLEQAHRCAPSPPLSDPPFGMPIPASATMPHFTSSPMSTMSRAASDAFRSTHDEESGLGHSHSHAHSHLSPSAAGSPNPAGPLRTAIHRLRGQPGLVRRPTGVRVVSSPGSPYASYTSARPSPTKQYQISGDGATGSEREATGTAGERTPLIKPGVTPDVRAGSYGAGLGQGGRREVGLGRMIELGLPLIIAREISRTIFRFRRMGCLESVGPAGMNAMQGLVQSMTDQLGAMERIIQTPLPVIFGVHLKQTVSLFLFILPFTLVDLLKWKMVFIVTACAFTMMGVEHIAAQVEQPFGTDACDLNLDLFCTELLCECEAILERLPEGDADPLVPFLRSDAQVAIDSQQDDDDGGDDAE